jgi:hypothetical protein
MALMLRHVRCQSSECVFVSATPPPPPSPPTPSPRTCLPWAGRFAGGKLNVSVNCLDRHLVSRGDQVSVSVHG